MRISKIKSIAINKYISLLATTFFLVFTGQSVASLLADPGFEANDPSVGWGFISGGGLVAETGPNSPEPGAFISMGLTPPSGTFTQIISKAVPISSGQILDLTLDYKQFSGGSGNLVVQTRYYTGVGANGFSEAGGGTLLGENTITLPQSINAWNTYSTGDLSNIWSAADYVEVRIIGNAFGIPLQGSTLVDNVNLTAIPEPATLSMVALFGGGIMFIRKRLMI